MIQLIILNHTQKWVSKVYLMTGMETSMNASNKNIDTNTNMNISAKKPTVNTNTGKYSSIYANAGVYVCAFSIYVSDIGY